MGEIILAMWRKSVKSVKTCARCKKADRQGDTPYCKPCRQQIHIEKKAKQALEIVIKHF